MTTESEFEENDITDTKGVSDMVEESTEPEMARQTHTTLMITTDREKVWIGALVKEQDHTVTQAMKQFQKRHLEEVQAIVDAACHCEEGCSGYKCHSASHEDDVKRFREESPEAGIAP